MKLAKMMIRYPTGRYLLMTYQLDEMIDPSQPAVSSCLEPATGACATWGEPCAGRRPACLPHYHPAQSQQHAVTAEIGRSCVLCFEPRTPAGVSPGRHTICKSKIQRGEQH